MTKGKADATSTEQELVRSLKELNTTAQKLPRQFDFFFHPGKHLFFTFLKGIVSGLGVLASVVIVVPLILWMLRGIEWVPLVGDFVTRVAEQVEEARQRR